MLFQHFLIRGPAVVLVLLAADALARPRIARTDDVDASTEPAAGVQTLARLLGMNADGQRARAGKPALDVKPILDVDEASDLYVALPNPAAQRPAQARPQAKAAVHEKPVAVQAEGSQQGVLQRIRKELWTTASKKVWMPSMHRFPQNPFYRNGKQAKSSHGSLATALGAKDDAARADPTAHHVYQSDGLLAVHPDAAHPIYELIAHGEAQWRGKRQHASRTLPQAVKEYRRRYGREPPTGFGAWWKYAQANNVQLPDEYDQIHRDLEPFWGMAPADLEAVRAEFEAGGDTWTVGKDVVDAPLRLLNTTIDAVDGRGILNDAYALMDVLKEVEGDLGVFRAVIYALDNPQRMADWEIRSQALEHARKGQVLDLSRPRAQHKGGWPAMCAPDSPARTPPFNMDRPPPPRAAANKTFVHDAVRAMDPCAHPAHFHAHGQFLNYQTGPAPAPRLVPTFAHAVSPVHQDIRVAMPRNLIGPGTEGEADDNAVVPWAQKDDARLYWRGRNTGVWHARRHNWYAAHRIRAVELSRAMHGNMTLLPSTGRRDARVGAPVQKAAALVNPALMDVTFIGEGPVSCDEEEGVCKELEEMFEWRAMRPAVLERQYKYILDLDGHSWSSRFRRLISANAVIFKSTVYPEWFHDRLQPWVHYVPIQNDYSDLHDALLFFRGDEAGANAHDDLAQKIAEAGREWSRTFWRRQDVVAYMFRLFLEYARVMSEERASMSFDLEAWLADSAKTS